MANNFFYKALAALSTVGILAAAGSLVPIAMRRGNSSEDQITKTMVDLKNARKDALAEIKIFRKEVLNELKTERSNALGEVKAATTESMKAIKQVGGKSTGSIWLVYAARQKSSGSFPTVIDKIEMESKQQCEVEGAKLKGSEAFKKTMYDYVTFACVKGK